jgi:hypothetical protein
MLNMDIEAVTDDQIKEFDVIELVARDDHRVGVCVSNHRVPVSHFGPAKQVRVLSIGVDLADREQVDLAISRVSKLRPVFEDIHGSIEKLSVQ